MDDTRLIVSEVMSEECWVSNKANRMRDVPIATPKANHAIKCREYFLSFIDFTPNLFLVMNHSCKGTFITPK